MTSMDPVNDLTKLEPEEEDHIVCEICLSGTVYEGNEILFCDKCNVSVHQGCYGVGDIPEGQWFCYVCAAGFDPATTVCEVCPFTGGPYKPTYKTGKWAHSLCCQWIPEIYVSLEKKGHPALCLSNVDKKRFKLRCALCNINKGACVQCCYGRCTTAVHPWCALKNPQGCTRRVVLNAEGETMWEIFCKTHASAVSEPIKPKPKAKQSVPLYIEEAPTASQASSTGTAGVGSSKKEYKQSAQRQSEGGIGSYFSAHIAAKPVMSMSHAKNFSAARLLRLKDFSASSSSPRGSVEYKADDYEEEELDAGAYFDDSDCSDAPTKRNKPTKKASKSKKQPKQSANTAGNARAQAHSADTTTYPILSMLEWPGISEGEPMDLDHFWNVVSGYYPEDHSQEWLSYMLTDLQKPIVPLSVQSVLANNATADSTATSPRGGAPAGKSRGRGAMADSNEHSTAQEKSEWDVPPLGHAKLANRTELVESAEELLNSMGGERERAAVLDEDKRIDALRALSLRLAVIKGQSDPSTTTNNGVKSEKEQESSASQDKTGVVPHCDLFLKENEFYTKPSYSNTAGQNHSHGNKIRANSASIEDIEYPDNRGLSTLRSVFDGTRRFACEFKIHLPDPSLPNHRPPALPPATNSRRASKWHEVGLTAEELSASSLWAADNLIPTSTAEEKLSEESLRVSIQSALSMRDDVVPRLSIALDSMEPVADSKEVHLPESTIIPRDEDNSLVRALRTDIHAYHLLTAALQSRMSTLLERAKLDTLANTIPANKAQWDMIDALYTKQQIWKAVCSALHRGVRDQAQDFNVAQEEAVPASWQIQVTGRPTAAQEEAEEEPHEDAVCMCCFDGTSVEGNRILFCDGCNAALHQVCYGVHTIPEGDFYCDRCQYITLLAGENSSFDYYHAKTAVMCCLCPLQHGGLKPTTDGRWVHLCCALWSPDTVIVDLTEMSPINISRVPVQLPIDAEAYPGNNHSHQSNSSYGRAGRAVSGGADDASTELFRQNCLLTPLKEACMFCNLHGGRVQQCCYTEPAFATNSSSHSNKCTKVFHPLCAWFEGVYMSSTIEDPTFQGATRNSQFPSGLTFCFLCDAHTATARPNPSTRTEQQKLRVKYRIKVDDLEQIPGTRRRKKPKKQKQSNNMSLGRVGGAGGAETKDLNVDVYDGSTCACCMMPLSSDVFMCGAVSGAVPQWEIEEGVADLTLLPPAVSTDSASNSAVTASNAASELVKSVPTDSSLMDVVVSPSAQSSDGFSNSSTVMNTVPFATPFIPQSAAYPSYAVDAPPANVETVQVGQHLTLTQSMENVSSSDNLTALPLLTPVTSLLGDTLPASMTAPAFASASTLATTATTFASEGGALAVTAATAAPANAYKCKTCGLHIHKLCLVGNIPLHDSDFTCDVCLLQPPATTESASPPVDARCVLCPRRGGYLKRTTDFKWAHVYCASTVPGQMRIVDHKIDVRAASGKKEKCVICNRKQGVCVQCSHVGCTTQFHPLCAARSGKGVIRTRMGEKAAYCFAHLPEGVERLGNGHWVDGFEVERLRYGLERARLILDVLCKREKYKKMLCKAETELLSIRFHKTLDRAKKRKHSSNSDEVDLSDMSLYSSESEYATDSDLDPDGLGATPSKHGSNKLSVMTPGEFVPLDETLGPAGNRGEGMSLPVSTGEEVQISATWIKRKEVRLPKRLITTFSGIEVDRKDVQREANARSFLKHYRDALQKNTNAFRTATQLFTSAIEEAEFGRTVGTKLKKHMVLPMDEFRAAVKGSTWLKLDGPIKPKATSNMGRPKKGYAFVEVEEAADDEMHVVDSADEEFKIRRASHHKKGNTASAASSTVKPKFRSNSDLDGSVSAGDTPNTARRPRGRPPRQHGLDAWLHSKDSNKASAAAALAGAADDWEDLNSAQSTPQVATTGRKKSKKQMQMDAEAAEEAALALAQTQAAEAFSNSKGSKRGRRGEETEPVAAPSTAKKLTKKEQAAADALVAQQEEAARAAEELASSSKRIKKSKRALEEDIEASAVEVVDSRTKRQRLREEAAGTSSLLPASDQKFATNPNGTTVMDASNTLVYVKQKEDSKKYSAATLYVLERRLKDILVDILTHEVPEDSDVDGSAPSAVATTSTTSKSKSKAKKAPVTVAMRRLAEDFESVPYDAIPDYDSLVGRVVTLDSMEEKLGAHEYRSMQEFCEDFYVLLNNARSITTPDCITWADSALLAELFETSKTNSAISSSAARPRAEGKEIVCTKISGGSNSSSAGSGGVVSSPRSQRAERASERVASATAAAPVVVSSENGNGNSCKAGSDGKMRWTCACCNTLYAVSNWPADFDISMAYMPRISSSTTTASADDAAGAPVSSAMAKYSSGEWAAQLIAKSGNNEFQYPEDYVFNTRDSQDRRDRKEAALREQWAAALACTHQWRFLCGTCVLALGAALVGTEVMVWWHDDALSYRGTIDAFDEASGTHRVLYEDNEWEFVNMAIEPVAFGSTEDFVLPVAAPKKKK